MKHSLRFIQFLGVAGLLATPCISTAQLLAQESFLFGSAGVGYIPELNLERADQNAPTASSGFQKWTDGFDSTDSDTIEDRWSLDYCGCAYVHFLPNRGSLIYPHLALSGGKLNVATGGLTRYGKLNTTVDGPLAAYTSEGKVIDGNDDSTLFLSFLIQLKNIIAGSNQNLVTLIDGVNTDRIYDETADVYLRNPSKRLSIGQFWDSDSFGINGNNFAPLDTEIHLIVIKIEFKSGDDTASVYFDPDVTQPESAATLVATIDGPMTFDAISIVSQQANKDTGMALDEFRFGASWESVVPATEEVTLSVASDKEGIPAVNTWPANMEVNCQAFAKTGERFIRWTGDVTEANEYQESISVIMDTSKSLRAIIGMDMWGDDTDLLMLGSGFLWRKDIGYMYEGYYPFLWIYGANNWVYVFDESGSASDGYFIYDFGRNAFGFTGADFYPYYLPLSGANNILLGAPLE